MGRATSFLLFSSLPDHKCSCVFVVPARTADGTAHIGSSLYSISITVSIQSNSAFSLSQVKQLILFFFTLKCFFGFPFRVWLLRKMLIVLFSRRTEKNSKILLVDT